MAVYLVQHGKNLPKEMDPDQGLSEEGSSEARSIAEVANGYGVVVARIDHSVKKRARQTAHLFAAILSPPHGVHEVEGLKPLDDVERFARSVDSRENRMVVGHLPFLDRLTAYLITGNIQPGVFSFQNGGIVCLATDSQSGLWTIRWSLMPHIR